MEINSGTAHIKATATDSGMLCRSCTALACTSRRVHGAARPARYDYLSAVITTPSMM